MKKSSARWACLVTLLIASGSAWCSASTSGTITNFRVELIDLDPNDGIAPSINFDPYGVSTAQSGVYATLPTETSRNQANAGSSPFAAVWAVAADGTASASSSIVGNAFGQGAVISSSASTDATSGYSISDGEVGFANQVEIHRFTLSPETTIVISGDATFMAETAHDQPSEQADTGLILGIDDTDGNFASDSSWIGAGSYADQSTTTAQTLSMSFRIFYDNTSDLSWQGAVGGALGSYATSDGVPTEASTVPEPATAVLLLAALGMLVTRTRGQTGTGTTNRAA